MADVGNVLSLRWAFGFNRDVSVHNLCDENRAALFFASAHTGVIYDLNTKHQTLLQGHCAPISCTAVSADRRWIATADTGSDSMLVLWDAYTGTPSTSIANPHPAGVLAMDMSADARYIVTLSADTPQVLAVWDLHSDSKAPLHSAQVGELGDDGEPAAEQQTCVRFDPMDPCSILTNGAALVVFWSWQDGELTYYAPPIGERDFKQPVGVLTRSCFIPNTCRAVSVTTDGDVLVWDRVELPEVASTDRRATKLLRLHAGAIGFVDTVGDMIVTGAADGHVRFFDFDFRVLAWFEDLDAGAINHVSFACQPAALEPRAGASLACPDFIVGTGNALVLACQPSMFEALTPDARRGTLLVQGQDAPVHGLAAHPLLPRFAVTGHSGLLQLWDYAEKRLLLLRMFDRLLGNCLAFSPNGKLLAIGFTNGDIKVLNGLTLKQVAAFTVSKESVTHLDFSHCSSYLAAASAEHTVSIYRPASGVGAGLEGGKEDWEFVGKHRAHTKPVVSLNFNGTADANAPPRLLSLGEDRSLIEFDLARSTIADGVQLTRPPVRIEQTSLPTACLWLPGDSPGAPPTIVAANDGYKLRTLASDSMALMHTSLGPTYGGPLTKLVLLPAAAAEGATGEDGSATGERYVAYSTYEKVVGVVKLPLDGNPNKAMGLIAHPGELTGMAVSCDGKWLITAGGADLSIHLWQVDTGALDEMAASGGEGFAPFESLIEGGKGGDFYEEMRDYFYYAQLRAQGEDTTEARRITGKVPVTEIGNLLRAFGYYPSEREIDEIVQEVRMAAAGDDDAVDFETLLRLYINHRPVLGVSKDQIGAALSVLSGGEAFAARDVLKDVLKGSGESLTPDDLAQCLRALVGAADADDALPFKVDGKAFAEDVLGFEDYGDEGAAQ